MAQQQSGIHIKASDSRLGRFTLRDKILRDSINTGLAARLFYGSVPIDVKRDWISEKSTFTLWHPSFDAISEGAVIPEYIAVVENGVITWERVEDNAGEATPFTSEKLEKWITDSITKKQEVAA